MRSRRSALARVSAALICLVSLVVTSGSFAAGPNDVVPISSPNVELVANVPVRGEVILGPAGGRFKTVETPTGTKTYFFMTGTFNGLTVIDATIPEAPVIVGNLVLPHFENEDVDISGDTLLISVDGSTGAALWIIDISVPHVPRVRGVYKFNNDPYTWGTSKPGHIANCIASCRYAYVGGASGGYIAIVDLGDPRDTVTRPKLVGVFRPPAGYPNAVFKRGTVHDVNIDSTGIVWMTGSGGLSAYRVDGPGASPISPVHIASHNASGLNNFILHNSLRPDGGPYVYVTEENYIHPTGDCRGSGRFEVYHFDGSKLTPVSQWSIDNDVPVYAHFGFPGFGYACSAHWFDRRSDGLVAMGHYQRGVRLLDSSNPESVREVGWWGVSDSIASAAYFHPTDSNLVYAVDYQRGIDVLRICDGTCAGGGGLAAGASLGIRRDTNVTFVPSPQWGYACPGIKVES